MSFATELQQDFENMLVLRASTGFANETYACTIPPFLQYCGSHYPDASYINEEMVNSWLNIKQYSVNSRAVFIAMLRKFTKFRRFLGKEDFFFDDEYSVNRIPYVPYTFQDEELVTLFNAIDSYVGTGTGKKFLPELVLPVYSRLLYCCGMRPQEPSSLLTDDIDLTTGDIYIRKSKRHKDRHIVLSEDMRQLCLKYDSLSGSRKWFFQRPDGKPYTRKWFYRAFSCVWKECFPGRKEQARPYDLRHAFASRNIIRWIESGKDVMAQLTYLSAYMGHSEITSTLYYVHLLPDNLRKAARIDWELLSAVYGEDGVLYED